MPQRHVTEDEISAWVNGELGPADRARVQAWLQAHPDAAARAARWAADRDALRQLLGPAADEPVPEALRATVMRSSNPPRWALAAAAAGLLVAGGLVGDTAVWQGQHGMQTTTAAATGWVQRAAFAHSVYVPEPRHAVEVKAQEEHLARWLTRRIEVPVKLFDLSLPPASGGPAARDRAATGFARRQGLSGHLRQRPGQARGVADAA